MVSAGYPGLNEGGISWFRDLTVADPYYILPVLSAASLFVVQKIGAETGQRPEHMTPAYQVVLLYAIPLLVLFTSSQFASVSMSSGTRWLVN